MGSIPDDVLNIRVISEDPVPKAVQTFTDHISSSSPKNTKNTITCSKDYPKGHLYITSLSIDSDTLNLESYSEEICEDQLPDPEPPQPGSTACDFSRRTQDNKYLISINLQAYNNENFWHSEVGVEGITGYPNAEIFYQPCGAIRCPSGAFCEGKDDATVWLCFDAPDKTRTCRSFGQFYDGGAEIDIYPESYADPTFSTGLKVIYHAELHDTTVYYKCNNYLNPGNLTMPSVVTFKPGDPESLFFNVSAEDACSVGPPRWIPNTPTKPTKPTPTPQPSPNPIDFVANETHYIYTNLDQITQPVFNQDMKLAYPGATLATLSQWHVIYHPWDQTPCPNDAYCFDLPPANIWGCWTEDSGRYVCFPIGDVDYGNDMRARTVSLDYGVELLYEGAWGVKTEITVTCNPNSEASQILFDSETKASWSYNNGNHILFETDSGYVCPLKFNDPDYLPKSPSPTPVPKKYKGPYKFMTPRVDNAIASINIKKIKVKDMYKTYVGYRKNLRPMDLVFSPVKKIDCPSGYNCLGGAKSNVWYCGNYNDRSTGLVKACLPGGDIDAGLDVSVINESYPMAGINVNYDGGYGNATETHMIFQCDPNVTKNEIDVDPVILRYPPNRGRTQYLARIRSSDICPQSYKHKKATGGAVFLFILILVALFFPIMVIAKFISKGEVIVPGAEFWDEVLNDILFIVTCGRSLSTKQSYDSI